MVMMSKQLKVLNDKFIEWTRRKAEAPKENDRLTEPKHIQAEMLRLEAEEKFREADEAVEKRRLEAEEKRQREAEEQQRRKVEEKLKTTKQQTSIRDFQEGENGHLSDNRASTQVKKRKNLGKPKSSHRKDLKQTNKAGTEQRSNASGRWKYRREVGRNRSKAKAAQRRRTDATAPKQDAAALEKLKLLAEKGDSTAQFSLGIKHRRSRNDGEAAKWYRRAAQQGDAAAQYNLGWMYEYGEGVVKDKWEAVKWYRRAAQQGNAAAQYNLGWMYQHGRGVPQNDAEAVKWYRKAAQQGYSAAQDNLDWMYQNGRGVEQI